MIRIEIKKATIENIYKALVCLTKNTIGPKSNVKVRFNFSSNFPTLIDIQRIGDGSLIPVIRHDNNKAPRHLAYWLDELKDAYDITFYENRDKEFKSNKDLELLVLNEKDYDNGLYGVITGVRFDLVESTIFIDSQWIKR